MKKTRLQNLYTWSRYQEDRAIDFNGFYWAHEQGGVLVDPMPLAEGELQQLRDLGGAKWILVSNADHLRASLSLKEQFGAELLAPRGDRDRFDEHEGAVDRWYESAEDLPHGIEVHWITGGKSPVEPFFYLPSLDALLFADVVRSHVTGELMLLPDAKLQDRSAVVASLQGLEHFSPQAILLGDGDSIFLGAAAELARFHASLRS